MDAREAEPGQIEVQQALGRRLQEVRRARGWTQEEAAARLGMGWRRLQDIEGGSVNLTLRVLVRLANAYGVQVGDLFDRSPP